MDKKDVLKVINLNDRINKIDNLIRDSTIKVNVLNYQNFYLLTGIDAHEIEVRLTKNLKAQIKARRDKLQKELDSL